MINSLELEERITKMAVSASTIRSEEIIPPYYDRYLDEREKRFVTEIERMRSDIKLNTQRLDNSIGVNTQRLDTRIDELKDYVIMRFDETNKRIDGLDKSLNASLFDNLFICAFNIINYWGNNCYFI